MKAYQFDESGLLVGEVDVVEPGEGESLPERVTLVAPPELHEAYQPRFNGADWTIEIKRPVF